MNLVGLGYYYKAISQARGEPKYVKISQSEELWAFSGSNMIRYSQGYIIISKLNQDVIYQVEAANIVSVGGKAHGLKEYFWWIDQSGRTAIYDGKGTTYLADLLVTLDYCPKLVIDFWGISVNGKLVNYSYGNIHLPTQIKFNLYTRTIDLTCGDDFIIMLSVNGTLNSLGANNFGQLGLGHTKPQNNSLNQIDNDQVKGIISIKASGTSVAALTVSGETYHWGGSNINIVVGPSLPVFKLLSSQFMLALDKIVTLTGATIRTQSIINAAATDKDIVYSDKLGQTTYKRIYSKGTKRS